MIKKSSATLVDVARMAGVSLKTASRALNESPEVREETAERVRAAMSRLRYQPNELARGLKAKRSAAIGMIVPNLADPFSAAATQAVQAVARENGYIVMLASSGGDPIMERSEIEVVARRQIDGLILVAADSTKSSVKPLLANVPVVVFDEPIRGEDVDVITVTNRKGAHEATQHLLWHGYRRILAVGARPYLFTCAERVAGYRKAIREAGAEPIELLIKHEHDLTPELLSQYLTGPDRVEAIFSLNWVCTMLVLRALKALGKHVGEDVALISFDDFELAEMIPPGLTVVRQPSRELGECAAKVLFERMQSKNRVPHKKMTLETEFIIRGSCGCDPTAKR